MSDRTVDRSRGGRVGLRIGLHALGIGPGADPDVITAVARAAEMAGFATLWAGEHVVMLEGPDTPYPYAADGRIAVPADADWLDPFATLTFAAAATSRLTVATGVLLLPEHHPLVVAKQAASLDVLSRGRVRLGIGIGWSAGEFAALGIPFEGRAGRTREYVEVLRMLWREDVASFGGRFVEFGSVRSYPKPVRRRIPVVLGGNSDTALRRVAAYGDGWYGFNVATDELGGRLTVLDAACREAGRTRGELHVAVALSDGSPEQRDELAAAGVDELVVVEAPPADPAAAARWVGELAERWGVRAEP